MDWLETSHVSLSDFYAPRKISGEHIVAALSVRRPHFEVPCLCNQLLPQLLTNHSETSHMHSTHVEDVHLPFSCRKKYF